jgi:hypothetical protein
MQMFYRMLLISKISLQPDEYFELLEEKNTLLSVHLETQILSYRLSRKKAFNIVNIHHNLDWFLNLFYELQQVHISY